MTKTEDLLNEVITTIQERGSVYGHPYYNHKRIAGLWSAYLDGIIDTAEGVILPLLTEHEAAIQGVELVDNIAYFYTVRPHGFVEGQTVVINNVGAPFDGSRAVTDVLGSNHAIRLYRSIKKRLPSFLICQKCNTKSFWVMTN